MDLGVHPRHRRAREPRSDNFRITIQESSLSLVPGCGVLKNLPQFQRRNREDNSIPYRLDHADR